MERQHDLRCQRLRVIHTPRDEYLSCLPPIKITNGNRVITATNPVVPLYFTKVKEKFLAAPVVPLSYFKQNKVNNILKDHVI